jgi:hypothetical protein
MATAAKLTVAQRKALAVLLYGRRHAREVTESNISTAPEHWSSMPLFVYWQTVRWLEDQGYVSTAWMAGRMHVTLTDAGVDFAESQDL